MAKPGTKPAEDPGPSLRQAVAARERFGLSQRIRAEAGYEHTYPGRSGDAETVLAFAEAYGELPPSGVRGLLAWWLRRGVRRGVGRLLSRGRGEG